MNVKKIITTVVLFAATGAVFANDLMPFSELDNFKSSKTRADVKAVVLRDTRANTLVAHGDITAADQPAVVVKNTRARAEAIESAKNQSTTPNGKSGS
jgi:hypothetical protein